MIIISKHFGSLQDEAEGFNSNNIRDPSSLEGWNFENEGYSEKQPQFQIDETVPLLSVGQEIP